LKEIDIPLSPSDGIIIENCPSCEDGLKMVSKSWFIRKYTQNLSLFLIIIKTTSSLNDQKLIIVQKTMDNFKKKIILISFENSMNKSQIFWKFGKENIYYLKVEPEILYFVINFLTISMKEDMHSGVSFSTSETVNMNKEDEIYLLDILSLTDSRDLNLLMLAAERGDENSIKYLLEYGFDIDDLACGKSAADLAWENHHYNIVLKLLQANSLFPRNYNKTEATDGIRKFVDQTRKLRNLIRKNRIDQVREILDENINLRHFYSTKNISADALALLCKNIEIYKLLVSRNVYIGPKEDINKILKNLNEKNRENLQGIHLNLIQSWNEKHLMILTSNSFVGHDVSDVNKKLKYVKEAFKFLDQSHPLISLILKIVAASRDFKIIFDFNRFSINHLDPVSSQHTKGIFYTTRHIYIAAKQILDSQTKLQAYGTIAHELCHFALLLVYGNNCKPYHEADDTKRLKFSAIACLCFMKSHQDELIEYVFKCYKSEQQHAELAVRVPQIIVEYSSDEEKLANRRENFPELFEFIQNEVFDDIEETLPEIEIQADEKIHKFAHKTCKHKTKVRWLWILIAFLISLMPFLVWITISLVTQVEEIYGCRNLTGEPMTQILGSVVNFQGANMIFSDLFGINESTELCEILDTEHVMRILRTSLNVYCCDNEATNKFGLDNFPDIGSNSINFSVNKSHGLCKTNLAEIHQSAPKLRKQSLIIGDNVQPKFYIHRNMTVYADKLDEDALFYKNVRNRYNQNIIITNSFSIYHKTKLTYSSGSFIKLNLNISKRLLTKYANRNINKTILVDLLTSDIHQYYESEKYEHARTKLLENRSIIIWSKIDSLKIIDFNTALDLIKMVSVYTTNIQWIISDKNEIEIHKKLNLFDNKIACSSDEAKMVEFFRKIKKSYVLPIVSYWNDQELDIHSFVTSINLLFHEINRNRVHLLADTAGSGKSTTFRYMTWKLKRNFPYFWVSYISLKDHVEAIKDIPEFGTNLTLLTDFVASKILNLTNRAEIKLFKEKFAKNKTIFLWDGVDEVSPKFLNETLKLTWKIFELTRNQQWISTRPLHQNTKAKKFKIPVMKLKPYDKDNRREFIERFLESVNISTNYALKRVESFVHRLEARKLTTDNMIHSPLMLFMICNAYVKNISLDNSTNLYKFYESYVETLFDMTIKDKGGIVKADITSVHLNEEFRENLQHYAIKNIFDNRKGLLTQLDIILKPFTSSISERILRYPILFHDQNGQIEFDHQTFADFFVAQYFCINVYKARNAIANAEMELRINLLKEVFINEDYKNSL